MNQPVGNLRRLAAALPLLIALLVLLPAAAFAAPAATDRTVVPDAPAVPGEFLIKFRDGTSDSKRDAVLKDKGGHRIQRLEKLEVDAVEVPQLRKAKRADVDTFINALKKHAETAPSHLATGHFYASQNIAYLPVQRFYRRIVTLVSRSFA
jgi:hypothetical protein